MTVVTGLTVVKEMTVGTVVTIENLVTTNVLSHFFFYFKVLLESGLNSPRKKSLFFADFSLQNMLESTLPDGLESSGQRVYR